MIRFRRILGESNIPIQLDPDSDFYTGTHQLLFELKQHICISDFVDQFHPYGHFTPPYRGVSSP